MLHASLGTGVRSCHHAVEHTHQAPACMFVQSQSRSVSGKQLHARSNATRRVRALRLQRSATVRVESKTDTPAPWIKADARLVLADGSVWRGRAFGATDTEIGEVVFNTSITGYEEIMTDPSYRGQFVVFTHPHIGNVGINTGK